MYARVRIPIAFWLSCTLQYEFTQLNPKHCSSTLLLWTHHCIATTLLPHACRRKIKHWYKSKNLAQKLQISKFELGNFSFPSKGISVKEHRLGNTEQHLSKSLYDAKIHIFIFCKCEMLKLRLRLRREVKA